MEPEFGSEVRQLVFSLTDDETDIAVLKFLIKEAIEEFEKRVSINSIEVIHDEKQVGEGTWVVEIDFYVIKYLKNDSVKFAIN